MRTGVFVVAAVVLAPILIVVGANAWIYLGARGKLYTAATSPARPVTIVLGAGITPDNEPSPFLRYRLDLAADLYKRKKTEVILVSGDNRHAAHDEPTVMRDYLVGQGIPKGRIVLDYAGLDTYDTCVRAKRIFGVTEAIITTQEYHIRRATTLCNSVGVDTVGIGDQRAYATAPQVVRGYLPREYLAAVKAVYDVVTDRTPILGKTESGVRDALRTPR